MSARPIMLDGVLYPKDKMHAPIAVTFMGVAYDPTLEIGGGPILPMPMPTPPVIWGPTDPRPTPPIYIPPVVPVPPDQPNVPPPGSPPVIVGGTQPVTPMVPPAAVLIEYPGIGKVVVPQPTATAQPPAGGSGGDTTAPPQAGQLPSTPIATPTAKK